MTRDALTTHASARSVTMGVVDTSAEAQRRLVAGWRAMSCQAKAELVNALSIDVGRLALAGIRQRHPGATAHEQRMRLGALRMGGPLMREAFDWDPRDRGY